MSLHDFHPIMKKLLILLLTAGIAGLSMADIQAPPGQKYGPLRKLSRGLANIVYGVTEIPTQWALSEEEGGASEQFAYGTVFGGGKTIARLGYGVYELITFPFATYKGTYRPPYHPDTREATHPRTGFLEFPPEVGFISGVQHTRSQVQ
jgi:putative exosortase-associated protein (TIGR04073 family)